MSFLIDAAHSHKWQLAATAVASGAAVASLIFAYQALEREERLSALKSSIPSLKDDSHELRTVSALDYHIYISNMS